MTRFGTMVALCATMALIAAPAMAADIFMKIDTVKGDALAKNYEGWIEVSNFTEGVSSQTPNAPGAGAGKPVYADVSVAKAIDATTPVLRSLAASGKRVKSVVIEATRSDEGRATPVYRITLEDVGVASALGGVSSGGGQNEQVSLRYRTITWEYFPQDARGMSGPPVRSSAIVY